MPNELLIPLGITIFIIVFTILWNIYCSYKYSQSNKVYINIKCPYCDRRHDQWTIVEYGSDGKPYVYMCDYCGYCGYPKEE